MRTALFWAIARGVVVIPYRRFGTTYRPNVQSPLNMGPIGCPATSVRNYNYTYRNSPEKRSSQMKCKYRAFHSVRSNCIHGLQRFT